MTSDALLSEVLVLGEGVVSSELDERLLLLERASNHVVTLNHTASDAVYLCDGTRTVAQVVGLLAGHYGRPVEQVQQDLLAHLHELVERGVLARQLLA